MGQKTASDKNTEWKNGFGICGTENGEVTSQDENGAARKRDCETPTGLF
jgi:hypothetical protein